MLTFLFPRLFIFTYFLHLLIFSLPSNSSLPFSFFLYFFHISFLPFVNYLFFSTLISSLIFYLFPFFNVSLPYFALSQTEQYRTKGGKKSINNLNTLWNEHELQWQISLCISMHPLQTDACSMSQTDPSIDWPTFGIILFLHWLDVILI